MASTNPRRLITYSLAGAVALVAIALGAYFIFFNSSPEEVSLESAVESAQSGAGASAADASQAGTDTATTGTETTGAGGGIAGEWVVDTSIGEFSFEDATSSFVGFRIQEQLVSIGATEAVGRTPTIDGSLVIEGTTITEAVISADMTDIVTNNSRRDGRVQEALSTDEFPIASFTLNEPVEIGSELSDGEQFGVTAVGDLTIAGVTNEIEMPLEAQVVGDLVVVVGSLDISFADWDVAVPSAAAVVSVEDHGPLEMQLFFTRG